MRPRGRNPLIYSRAEQLSDAAVHVTGVVAALAAVPILLWIVSIWSQDRLILTGAAIYGASLIAMLTCSACYNMTPLPAWKDALRRVDQSAIYLKIAGTYTAFAVLSGSHAGPLLAGLWAAALTGALLIVFSPRRLRWLSLALYLGMGWAGALAGGPMLASLAPETYALVLAGGSLYTLGLVFFLWERLPFHNTIWHVFVLGASAILYMALVGEIWARAAA